MAKAQEIQPAHPNYLTLEHFTEIRDAYEGEDNTIKVGTSVAFLTYVKEYPTSYLTNMLTIKYGLVLSVSHGEKGSRYDVMTREGEEFKAVYLQHLTRI
jgi:hypothetical protein